MLAGQSEVAEVKEAKCHRPIADELARLVLPAQVQELERYLP
jgi:hypothetical protein